MSRVPAFVVSVMLVSALCTDAPAQDSQLLSSPVPDALTMQNGDRVTSSSEWIKRRRPQILQSFAANVYGKTPLSQVSMRGEVGSVANGALNGKAIRKSIAIRLGSEPNTVTLHLLYYLPSKRRGRVPTFVALGFDGNHTVANEQDIPLPEVWTAETVTMQGGPNKERRQQTLQRALESTRGKSAAQWQAEKIVESGFGLATVYCGDIEPDFDGSAALGIRKLFPGEAAGWSTLGAWAWGLSRMADYLAQDPDADPKRLMLMGHSRLGKAAMWAAAQDQRFAVVISNESGVGGASLYRTRTGETIEHLNTAFPHWFCKRFHSFTRHPEQVPVDGNMLLALIAPRPLYVASAELDKSSNPAAEFYSAALASQVYELLGKQGLGTTVMPALETPIMHTVGYHVRSGKHDVLAYDWEQYLRFARLQTDQR